MELLTCLVMANHQQQKWEDQMVLHVTDNPNVQSCGGTRRSGNTSASEPCCCCSSTWLEAEDRFTVDGVFVRTYHNTLNDWLTGEELAQVHQVRERVGGTSISPLTGKSHCEGWSARHCNSRGRRAVSQASAAVGRNQAAPT